jgi:hypothetical protein
MDRSKASTSVQGPEESDPRGDLRLEAVYGPVEHAC